jgi:hypothetical protein
MEIECRDVFEQTQLVNVPKGRKRRDLVRAFDERWPETPQVMHWDVESLHQRTGVLPEALLARHECVAVVEVFHLALLEVVGETDIVVRREQQAGAFALSHSRMAATSSGAASCSERRWSSPNTMSVSVSARILSSIGSETRLVNALENGDRMAGDLASNLLEAERGTVEKLQRTRNPL